MEKKTEMKMVFSANRNDVDDEDAVDDDDDDDDDAVDADEWYPCENEEES